MSLLLLDAPVNTVRPSSGDSRRVRRALLRGTPVSPEDLPIAEGLLAHMPHPLSPRRAVMLAIGLMFLLVIGGLLLANGRTVLGVTAVVLGIGGSLAALWTERMGRAIRGHSD